jgi:hypothetical protein
MKKRFTLLFSLSLLLHLSLCAQSAFHVPFGQSPQEVQTFLESRDYISDIESGPASDTIRARAGRKLLEYRFEENKLYAIRTSHLYLDKKQADEQFKSCTEYFKLNKCDTKNISDPQFDRSFVSVENSRICQVNVLQNKEDESVLIEMTVISRNFGPRQETEAYANEISSR